jgi:hypothetical protein
MNDELNMHDLELIFELARQALFGNQGSTAKVPIAKAYANKPLLRDGRPVDTWLQSTTDWARFFSVRVARHCDDFESDEYKDKYRPGEPVYVYRAACVGQRRIALLLHVPIFKIGSCGPGGLNRRNLQLKQEEYASAWYKGDGYVLDNDFDDWFPSLLETRMAPSPNSPVSLENKAYRVMLPDDMTPNDFEKKLQAVMLPAQMFAWLETADGIRHCNAFGVAPEIGKRSTPYNRGDRTKLSPATELYCFRRQSDPDRLTCALEKIVRDWVLGSNKSSSND